MKNRRNKELRSIQLRLLAAFIILVYAAGVIIHFANEAKTELPIIKAEAAVHQPDNEMFVNLVYREPISAETEPLVVSQYEAITLTEEEMDLLAKIVWLEARGESFEGQQAVVEVVFNRMLSEYFPDTLTEVIYEKNQFSTAGLVHTADPGNTQYAAIEAAMTGPNVLPLEVVFFSREPQNDNIWGSIGGHVFCYPWFWENG